MNDPQINKINGAITGLTAMVAQLQGSELALQQLLSELKPTLTLEQLAIVSQYWEHTREHRRKISEKFKPQLSPNDAQLFDSILLGGGVSPTSYERN
jgi:hypothetical protein